jgi:hypothetical protein
MVRGRSTTYGPPVQTLSSQVRGHGPRRSTNKKSGPIATPPRSGGGVAGPGPTYRPKNTTFKCKRIGAA